MYKTNNPFQFFFEIPATKLACLNVVHVHMLITQAYMCNHIKSIKQHTGEMLLDSNNISPVCKKS